MREHALQQLLVLAFGFAVGGLCASGYRLLTRQLPNLGMLEAGPSAGAFAMVPVLVVCGPFLIMRSALLGRTHEGHPFAFVFLATLVAGFWSLMSGVALVTILKFCGFFLA